MNTVATNIKKYIPGIVASIVLLLLFLPLSLKINFRQNDDWVYYGMVENFMLGKFELDPLSAPTFYTQGLLGALFASLFGIGTLPVLTLIVSVLCFYVLYVILTGHFNLKNLDGILAALLLFFNPLFVYSILGFMTENYYLLFFLLGVLYYLKFSKTPSKKFALWYVVFVFLAFNVRQTALVLPLSALLFGIFKRRKPEIILNGLLFLLLAVYYSLIFPRTPEMSEKSLQFHHLVDFPYVYALVFGSLILLSALLLPVLVTWQKLSLKKFLVMAAVVIGVYFFANHFFQPEKVSWGEFPYFENTFERKGFYPRGLLGTKYHFKYMHDLYYYWDLAAKIMVAILLVTVISGLKKFNLFWAVYVLVYFGVMIVAETFYDRYLIGLVPPIIFFTVENFRNSRYTRYLALPFLAGIIFLNYQFSMDFVLANNYAWDKSEKLSVEYDKDYKRVYSTHAWAETYPNNEMNYVFEFTYDAPNINKEYRENYALEEKHEISFPASIWVRPYIYVYHKNE